MKNKLVLVIYLLILNLQITIADTEIGYLNLHIMNRDPVVNNVYINPENIFADDEIKCIVDFWDESMLSARVNYKWTVNERYIENNKDILTNFEEGDIVTCSAYVIDQADVRSNEKQATKEVLSTTGNEKFVYNLVRVVNEDVKLSEIKEANYEGKITGFVVSNYSKSGSVWAIILVIFAGLILLNVRIYLKSRIKKE